MTFTFRKLWRGERVIGRIDGLVQELVLELPVLQHISRHRQLAPWSAESGGQLFGTISEEQIIVSEAAGPYVGDVRSRFRYRSNPKEAQQAINLRFERGLLYLGEWHTHAEDAPSASSLDNEAMRLLIENSSLNIDSLLMLIIGRSSGVKGLTVLSVSRTQSFKWELAEVTPV